MCNLPTVPAKGEHCATLILLRPGLKPLLTLRRQSVGQTGTCVVLSHQDLGLLDTAIQDSTISISHHYLPPLINAHEVLLLSPDPREDTLPTVYDPPSSLTPRTALTMPTDFTACPYP